MADPAAQSPFVSSSSSSARPEPAGPACRGAGAVSCVDPLVSSSQPVSLFAASPAVSGAAQGSAPPKPSSWEAFVPLSSSSSSSGGGGGGGGEPPKDSPGSPFELVPEREYAAALGERGALSQIPEDRVCDFPAKPPRGTSTPSIPSMTSMTSMSGTKARTTLEEVSKCVREMRSFTSEMLSWDWVERGQGAPPRDDGTPPHDGNPPLDDGNPPLDDGTPPRDAGAPPLGDADSSGDSDATVIEDDVGGGPPPPQKSSSSPPPPRVVAPPLAAEICPPPPEIAAPGGPKIAAPRPPEAEPERLRGVTEEPPPRPPPARLLLPPLAARDLVLWRDARRSGALFGGSLALLLALAACSAVSVAAHAALALLCGTLGYRVYRAVLAALRKADEGHPFRAYLELDVALSPEAFQSHAAAAMVHVNRALRLLLRLFLVEDLVDSLKLAVAMWLLTYVGAVFNGITLLILADLLAFTVPPVYEKYKAQIDHYVNMAREQTRSLVAKVQAKVPGMAKKKPE